MAKKKEGVSRFVSDMPSEETLRHQEVFEIYYAMGDARSLKLLGELAGHCEQTMEKWSVCFGWQERISLRDKELIRRVQEDYQDEIIKYRCFYMDLIKGLVRNTIKIDPVSGKPELDLKVTTVSDLEKLIKLHMQLMGDTGAPPGEPGTSGGGNGNVTIVLPQQIDMNQWQDMVKGPGANQTLTVKGS